MRTDRITVAWLVLAFLFLGGKAQAGPNAGGTLICHDPHYSYSDEGPIPCSVGTPPVSCEAADVELDGAYSMGTAKCFTVYAAFPPGSIPRLAGLTWGVQYNWDKLSLAGFFGRCADAEFPDAGWPAPGTGNTVTWNTPQTADLVQLYFFFAYLSEGAGSTALLRLAPNPTQGGWFRDDSVPPVLDAIAGYGSMGFDTPGQTACSWSAPQGPCCATDGSCTLTAPEACVYPAIFHSEGTNCDPNPCPQLAACCATNGTCTLVVPVLCLSPNVPHSEWSSCAPNPCDQPAACCYPSGSCQMRIADLCVPPAVGHPEWTSCSLNPCPQPPVGACCYLSTGACYVLSELNCPAPDVWHPEITTCWPNPCPQPPLGVCCTPSSGGCFVCIEPNCPAPSVWHGEWTTCSVNPCPQPPMGVCCQPSGHCIIYPEAFCPSPDVWHSDWTSCEPNPCPQPALHPCCTAEGDCVITTETDCVLPSEWHSEWTSCVPNSCPPPTPVEKSSWGRIKDRYR